jgi:predicted NodU family carbamoyl transferase
MKIVALHTEHDGAVAIVQDGRLLAYVEAQKDNHVRYSNLTTDRVATALQYLDGEPDVLAVGGWFGRDGGYHGCDSSTISVEPLDETGAQRFSTSHERAHIFCAYGLSPFAQGQPCYALIYDGDIGTLCSVDENCEITRLAVPLTEPGHRYAFLYELAHRDFPADSRGWSYGVAGKLMALASVRDPAPLTPPEQELMRVLLNGFDSATSRKEQLSHLPFWNGGHMDERFRRFAYEFSAALFDRFYTVAKAQIKHRWPLIIAGGCGLNCDWNSKLRDSGLFEDVFVPPCTDDSGVAIGVAADAQRFFTGSAKLQWDVYAGEPFEHDVSVPDEFESCALNYEQVARMLARGAVIAWVQGRYEIGPRALGNRSLLAPPFKRETTDRLNRIKQRESYRPVAPVCLEEEVSQWFEWRGASPHMLYFQFVKSDNLEAVTHDDGSARVQTVNYEQNRPLYELLRAFSALTGVGVLCNTSLNFPGRGFINRMSDLVRFAVERELNALVVEDRLYVRRGHGVEGVPPA